MTAQTAAVPAPRSWHPGALIRRAVGAIGALTVAAAAVAMAAVAVLPSLGMQLLIVTSGSMEPAIQVGDAAIVDTDPDPATIETGDVITFTGHTTETLTTHRVISLHQVGGTRHFRTQGDANPTPDPNLAPADGLYGRVRFTVPAAGHILAPLRGRYGQLLLAIPAILLLLTQLRRLRTLFRTDTSDHRSSMSPRTTGLIVAILVAAALAGAAITFTLASFTDTTPVSDNTFETSDSFS